MGQDLGLAGQSNETPEIGRYEMSDINYCKLMRSLNEQQTKSVLDINSQCLKCVYCYLNLDSYMLILHMK